ncbi:MAG: peptidoglycan DD-metalloendopeptidase family protein [Raineya sp.]|nr:peptidoglycan DD-metalloendopeptidase family protein [Raineya sp.]
MKYFLAITITFFLMYQQWVWGQPQSRKQQLEEQKSAKLKNIAEINKILEEASTKKQRSLGELNAINAQIQQREQIRNAIRREISFIEKDISDTEKIIEGLENDLNNLKKEYARMIYQASKISNRYNQITFVLSARSFNEFYRRIQFVRQYAIARRKQLVQILKTKEHLENQNQIIRKQREEKTITLASLQQEDEELLNLQRQQSEIVRELSQREAELRQQYLAEKRELQELEKQTLTLIRAEIKKTGGSETKEIILTNPEDIKLANSFAQNKGNLPWPVDNGFISLRFGKQKHPVIANFYIDNAGIKIQSKQGTKIRAVFEGKVEAIRERMGPGYSIMINHGDFFTIYEPVDNVVVKENERVSTQQVLGTIMPNFEGTPELLFCIYKNDKKLDPEKWLYKK